MHRLADVELRLIMHNVDAQSLLRFARCSRMLLHAADARHTWKHTPITLSSEAFTAQRPAQRLQVSHPLIRHAPVTLRVAASKRSFSVEDMLLSLARAQIWLFEFDASHSNKICAKEWRMLLAHPACRQLRMIRMSYAYPVAMDVEFWRSLSSLPHLHTAALCPLSSPESSPWQLSNLKCLAFTTAFVEFADVTTQLDRSRLHRLELRGSPLYLVSYFRSEAASHLHELSLPSADEMRVVVRDAIVALPNLRIVELIGGCSVPEWIAELRHARSLQRLMIAPEPFSDCFRSTADFRCLAESLPSLMALLNASAELRCAIHVSLQPTCARQHVLNCTAILQRHTASLLAAFPTRFAVSFR